MSYDYVALGHLHRPQRVREPHIRYSGSILKYSFSEVAHTKSVTLVDINGPGSAQSQTLALSPRREVRVIEGALETLLRGGLSDPCADDYVLARLTDRQAMLDVMGRLREVYPNVLQMQYVGFHDAQLPVGASQERLGKSHLALFEEFFEAIEKEPLTDPQRACLETVLDALHVDDKN
jgi:exonuclease SbcD